MNGQISFLHPARRYGFIRTMSGRVFFAAEELQNVAFEHVQPGNPVTFEIGVDRSGRPCAKHIWLGVWESEEQRV